MNFEFLMLQIQIKFECDPEVNKYEYKHAMITYWPQPVTPLERQKRQPQTYLDHFYEFNPSLVARRLKAV